VPISLLPELTETLEKTGEVLSPWARLVTLEEQILRRARGAFLTHWFGSSVPVKRLNLYIAIVNIEELKRRYIEVKRSMPEPYPELNLLGPLSGIAGLLVGVAVSPTGAILIATHIREILSLLVDEPWGGILAMLYRVAGIWILPILGPAAGVLAVPLLLAGALTMVLGGHRESRMFYRVLGELATLLDATLRFWDVITGPRSEVRNPLLRRILDLLDRFAGLFVQIVGFAALLITRFVRLLPHIMGQYRAMSGLIHAAMDAVRDIFDGFVDQLVDAFTRRPSPLGIVNWVLDSIQRLPGLLLEKVSNVLTDFQSSFLDTYKEIVAAIVKYVDALYDKITGAFDVTPVGIFVERLRKLLSMMPAIVQAFRSGPGRSKPMEEESSWVSEWIIGPLAYVFTGGFTGALDDLFESFGSVSLPETPSFDIPDFPDPPTIPDFEEILQEIGEPETVDISRLTERLRAKAERTMASRSVPASLLRDPMSAFAAERRALERERGRPRLLLNDQQLRDMIYLAVGRVLPAHLRDYAPMVREYFDMLDREVYDIEREPLSQPMLDIGASDRLRPIIRILRIQSADATESELVSFREHLEVELRNRTYLTSSVE
jgi:hypothetical protein